MFCYVQYVRIQIFLTLVLSGLNIEQLSVRSTQFPDLPTRANPLSLLFPVAICFSSISQPHLTKPQSTINNLKSTIQNSLCLPFVPIRFFRITIIVPPTHSSFIFSNPPIRSSVVPRDEYYIFRISQYLIT